ncbi:hypothetical protein [Gimesia chilikensis]|uniref:hypothetical protein n=1 Tax=Gimesia chilikensis TaxID=2605989 RepID=UPI003A94C5B1
MSLCDYATVQFLTGLPTDQEVHTPAINSISFEKIGSHLPTAALIPASGRFLCNSVAVIAEIVLN